MRWPWPLGPEKNELIVGFKNAVSIWKQYVNQYSVFEPGNYRYVKAVFQYSSGVAAQPGYEMERARFLKPLPLADAFAAVEAHLLRIGRPVTAFAACELRTAAPF